MKEDPETRSRIMRAVKGHDTTPELIVRRLLYGKGYRYRLHCKDLPGKPDLVFRGRRKVIFVHGCFWHGHGCARGNRVPKSNTNYWTAKISRNGVRDAVTKERLRELGWKVSIVWECELAKDTGMVMKRLFCFLGKG